jgi:hypothetical protein
MRRFIATFARRRPCEPLTTSRAERDTPAFHQFGVSYNPGKFTVPRSATPRSGNYLLYWMASQALWRVDPQEAKGLDATFAYDWGCPSVNRPDTLSTAMPATVAARFERQRSGPVASSIPAGLLPPPANEKLSWVNAATVFSVQGRNSDF